MNQFEKTILESEQPFRLLIDFAPVGIFQTDKEGRCLYTNSRCQQMTGFTFAQHLHHGWTQAIHPEDRAAAAAKWEKCSQEKHEFFHEFRLLTPEKKICWVHGRAVALRSSDGKKLGYVGTIEDISARKEAEENLRLAHGELEKNVQKRTEQLFASNQALREEIQERQRFEEELQKTDEQLRRLNLELDHRVQQRTAQLESANQELEAFSYSVSHDLKAPLRAIEGFTKILREDCGAQLEADGKRYLEVIISSSRQITAFVDGLLTYSRLGQQQMRYSEVNLQELVENLINELKPLDRSMEFKIHPLPPIFGDLNLLQQVWKYLLENAIKFTRPQPKAVIEVGAKMEPEKNIYYVKDNGVGFNMNYAGKLFKLFQRLHSEKEFEGIGVGLSVAQRLIYRHKGTIWVEAEVNRGATFYFGLPRKEKN
ncbi:MAG: PAS domain S-box protein [Verrucomicrobiota bacterium]|nr:PAS domain S-box protein [Verrucomicrobiota bacterium]